MLPEIEWLRPVVRFIPFALCIAIAFVSLIFWAVFGSIYSWIFAAAMGLSILGTYDLIQTMHNLMRNYPVTGRLRWILEGIRPQIRQYFIESNIDGTPFNHNRRTLVYERAKDLHAEEPFGTERDVYAAGYEYFLHSVAPKTPTEEPFRVAVGGPGCKRPYSMALLNVSAMSFGALSANAIRALNLGAKLGGFAQGRLLQCRSGHDVCPWLRAITKIPDQSLPDRRCNAGSAPQPSDRGPNQGRAGPSISKTDGGGLQPIHCGHGPRQSRRAQAVDADAPRRPTQGSALRRVHDVFGAR
jgi:hypothetical protein